MKTNPAITADGIWFRDEWGRVRLLRGCNVSSESKIPLSPPGETWIRESLNEKTAVSFVGRPFPEEEADEHFERFAAWGFTFLRWCITWEAVEHEGPGIYDENFLAYLRRMLKKAEHYGLYIYVDPHQDVWSRWTGGDGAPAWTLEAAGFDLERLSETGAALTHQCEGSRMPVMGWNLNYLRYACATMFTLFFGGNMFAPASFIEGEPAEDYLQSHYIAAMKHTARRIKDCKAVVGFGTMNEPSGGFIGIEDLNVPGDVTAPGGSVGTPFESMCAASGFPVLFRKFALGMRGISWSGTEQINAGGVSLFRDGYECPWKKAGVWDIADGRPVLKDASYFSSVWGKKVSFTADFLKPFQKKYIRELSEKHSQYVFFVEGIPARERVLWSPDDSEHGKIADGFHWYDGKTLLLKKWSPFLTVDSESRKIALGRKAVAVSFARQLGRLADAARADGIPPLLGEFGVPFDLDGGKSFKTGDYGPQEEALSLYYDAADRALLSAAVWNYAPGNTHEHGDGWNGEDLSLWCSDEKKGRAEKGFCRPYAAAVAGDPLFMCFDRKKRIFTFEWNSVPVAEGQTDPAVAVCVKPTEIVVPDIWFPEGWTVRGFDGTGEVEERPELQRLYVYTRTAARCRVTVVPAGKG